MDVFVGQSCADDRLDRFGFGSLLRGKPVSVEHVQEIGVATGVELIGAFDFYATLPKEIDNGPVQNRGAHLRFDVITNDRQILVRKSFCPDGIAGNKDGNVIDESEIGFKRAAGIEACCLLGSNRQVVGHDFRTRFAQFLDDLFTGRFLFQRKKRALRIVVSHVRGITIEHTAHHDSGSGRFDLRAKDFRAVRRRENRLRHVETHFPAVDVESGHNFDILRLIRPDLAVH